MEHLLEEVRSILDVECEYKELETDDDGTFEGYGSVFNNKDLGNRMHSFQKGDCMFYMEQYA